MRLDIFIPYWGPPAYTKETVRSVLAQSSDQWRLTVIDDAYPDPAIGRWLAELGDERIVYRRNEANRGITAGFRDSIQSAQEDLVAVVGADDVLLPNYVSSILDAHAAHPEATIIQPGVEVIDPTGSPARSLADSVKQKVLRPRSNRPVSLAGERLAASLLTGNWLYWPSLAFRTERVQKYDFRDGFAVIQDLALIIDMILAGESLLSVPEVAFQYRRHEASASVSALIDGTRLAGEREYFALAALLCNNRGWHRAELAARLHFTSRLHAFALIPRALRRRRAAAIPGLVRHALGS